MKKGQIIHTSGKRKQAVAKATLRQGNGTIRINGILLDNLPNKLVRLKIREPLLIAGEIINNVNIGVRVSGGGINSQAEATRLAISKGLVKYFEDEKLEKKFMDYDRSFLVADVRRNEPCKPNTHSKPRAKRQKSYR